ncbi:MAG: hypothetical protein ACXWP0_19415, partial [Ktedonobacterales bacterium]
MEIWKIRGPVDLWVCVQRFDLVHYAGDRAPQAGRALYQPAGFVRHSGAHISDFRIAQFLNI